MVGFWFGIKTTLALRLLQVVPAEYLFSETIPAFGDDKSIRA